MTDPLGVIEVSAAETSRTGEANSMNGGGNTPAHPGAAGADPVVVDSAPAASRSAPSRAAGILLALFLALLSGATALFGVFFLPWYWAGIPLPITALLGAGVIFWSIRSAYASTESLLLATLPFASWLLVSWWLSRTVTLGYPVLPGTVGGAIQWRSVILLGAGVLAGAVALGGSWGKREIAKYATVKAPPTAVA
ncbi:hypothetical protein EH165_04040 [Nakamurella antarctica]|uniref:Uncharacterized protein n=1 Tax=Nakamurella antarctica TaxID=1902245 RepID=A0A3G8ZSG2_9ACTN|nr:hypothetical protein [Nakamurella antarctica]AZI57454.1 hypothetical protein EH165_04040 [Nakamurella antarctica]